MISSDENQVSGGESRTRQPAFQEGPANPSKAIAAVRFAVMKTYSSPMEPRTEPTDAVVRTEEVVRGFVQGGCPGHVPGSHAVRPAVWRRPGRITPRCRSTCVRASRRRPRSLHLQPVAAERYEVWYFDTADTALFRNGIVARVRIKARSNELTLKFADQDCARIAPGSLPPHQSKCEYDVRGAASAAGAISISRTFGDDEWRSLLAKPGDLPAMLSPAQVDFLRGKNSAWPLPSPLLALGPVRVQPYRAKGEEFVVESWQFPSGYRLLEISQKSSLSNAPALNDDLRARLTRHGVAICPDQGSPAGEKLRDLLGR